MSLPPQLVRSAAVFLPLQNNLPPHVTVTLVPEESRWGKYCSSISAPPRRPSAIFRLRM
jgi:hypothetical protein